MGVRVKKASDGELLSSMSRMLVPADVLEHFEVYGLEEHKGYWKIELREKPGNVPDGLTAYDDVVLDGYCNPVELQAAAFVLKPVYLGLYRRRWKRSPGGAHHSNHYNFHSPGTKLVKGLGVFLKGTD